MAWQCSVVFSCFFFFLNGRGQVEEFSGAEGWECKALILNTKLQECEALIGERFNVSPWAMSLYCEIGLMRFAFGRQDKVRKAPLLLSVDCSF